MKADPAVVEYVVAYAKDHFIPLQLAAFDRNRDLVRLLLEHGANPCPWYVNYYPELAEIVKEVEAEKVKDGTTP